MSKNLLINYVFILKTLGSALPKIRSFMLYEIFLDHLLGFYFNNFFNILKTDVIHGCCNIF